MKKKAVAVPVTDVVRNHPHTAADGSFHRITLHDRGPESFDRYIVKRNGKMVHYGPNLLAAEATYDGCVSVLP